MRRLLWVFLIVGLMLAPAVAAAEQGETELNVTVIVKGCLPNHAYRVDKGGSLNWGTYVSGSYSWKPIGEIVTDEHGDGSFHYQRTGAELPPGSMTHSIWVNRADVNETVLISRPFTATGH
ncbi:MAG: hypothetical protein Q8P31_03775 [Bacillota bacterium]|nr:hypothetical protein [Bacillota bacterium]